MVAVQKSVGKTSNSSPQIGQGVTEHTTRQGALHLLLDLQKTVGNQTVLRLLRSKSIQAKLAIDEPGDVDEQEADRIADQALSLARPPVIQRKTATQGPVANLNIQKSQDETLIPAGSTSQPLDEQTRGFMESRFSRDFSDVRIHTDEKAAASAKILSADAYTTGRDIYFASGKYAPASAEGRHLIAHELTHTLQQRGASGPVARGSEQQRNIEMGSADDPFEREADHRADQVMTNVQPPRSARFNTTANLIQARPAQGLIQRKPNEKKTFVPYQIHVKQPMSKEEFKVAAMRQIFGGVLKNIEWLNLKDSYVPENSPYTVQVDIRVLKQQRGEISKERGISVEEGGGVAGAAERSKTFQAGPESEEKSALMKEIDRRYFEAVGDKTETKIKSGESGKAELWRTIRDEVLFQHEYIANLPPQVKELIKFATQGKDLTPADYDKLFAIAKKIEKMPAGQVSDYASKVTGTTTDLNGFEASLNKYIAEASAREKQSEERGKIQEKLVGLEEVYKKYRTYLTLLSAGSGQAAIGLSGAGAGFGAGGGIVTTREAMKLRAEIDFDVTRHGFAGIADFEAYIKKFEMAFEAGAANIAKDLLAKFAGKLYKESERYKDPTEISALHKNLGGVRTKQAELESGEQEVQSAVRAFPPAGGGGSIFADQLKKATQKRDTAQKELGAEVSSLGKTSPVFEEEGLPEDKKINKAALAKASEAELGGLVKAQIAQRMSDIGEAKAQINEKPELIYKMEKLMPQFYAQQGIKPGSIHDMIIQDKMRSDAILKLVKGIAFAMVAVALSVVTFGAATPVILAVGAGLAGAGLGAYLALEEYKDYAQQKNLAAVGFADDPSMVWVVIAVVGAVLDVAAALKAVKALGPAAKAFNASGDLAEFTKAVRALEQAGEIEAKVARAAEKAAEARKAVSAASAELTKVLGSKLYSFPGALLDPDVYKAVVKLARQAIKTKLYDLEKFIEEIRLARVNKKLGDLSPEEFAKAKQAWEEAKSLEAAEAALETAEKARVGTYTEKITWGIQKNIDARPHTSIKGAYWGRRTPQANPRVNAYELKINPNNESFFLPHPNGGLVQFENAVGTTLVQDGKVIIQQRSIYHVADMPAFAKTSVLAEANRQVAAASKAGMSVEWLVSEQRAVDQLTALFQQENIAISVRLVTE
jgi:Domain of unknown function (DUF4157)